MTTAARTLHLVGLSRMADGIFECLAWNSEGSHKASLKINVRCESIIAGIPFRLLTTYEYVLGSDFREMNSTEQVDDM